MANDSSLKLDITVTGYTDKDGKYNLLSYDVNIPKEQKEVGNEGVKKAMYENILTLIDMECRKVVRREDVSYELKEFAKTIGKIITNNYLPSIAKSKGE